ncbi:c-type cytochrome biogenesis protein CcmI [Rhodocyclus tenuis]|uniref:C-type cytochrome biogenesis protein CcmI n=1 Tax=Rhodocyclus gracilis TaxID=2929842 RepID=A0ABX0WKF6_9RHOO|nr:c-type cytochrome biogenesis protein CcmI [Rhodocyclus gracilis]NJA89251.1 c-type cytochrome biogenesis protein CcmI [Rhodocyclus gracilis]
MTEFILLAAALLVAVLLILAIPLLRPRQRAASDASDRRSANLAILRDQLADLEQERSEGTLSAADFEQARSELQRRLLDETGTEEAPTAAAGGRKTALAILLAVPIATAAGYALLGEPRALDPQLTQPASRAGEQQVQALVETLAARLKDKPDDADGWVTLARSYKALGRFTEAAAAYSRASRLVDTSAPLLADYAETLAQIADGSLLGRPKELIEKALKLDPDEPQTLLLAGAIASEERRFEDAANYWQRLLTQIDPNAEEAKTLAAAVAKARAVAAAGASSAAPASSDAGKDKKATAPHAAGKDAQAGHGSVAGDVTLAPALAGRVKPDDVIFVFARAEDGERQPLAALRGKVSELPLHFRLDDAAALPGGRHISDVASVIVEARIARSGRAQSSSGDLYGRLKGVRTDGGTVHLVIDQIEP